MLGEAAQAQRAHQPVHLEAVLARELGQPAGAGAAVELELPEPVLALHEALGEAEVRVSARLYARHAERVARDLDRRVEALDQHRAARLGQRAAEQLVPKTQRAGTRGCKRCCGDSGR